MSHYLSHFALHASDDIIMRDHVRIPVSRHISALLITLCLLSVCAATQTAPVVPSPAAASSALKLPPKAIGAQNLAARPYSPSWPKPDFPTGDRQPKQFAVEYVYRYLQTDYQPVVTLPQVTRTGTQQDTPEHTLIALITAIQTLDYDWWLSLWDARSQELFLQQAKEKKFDAAWWKARWQRSFQGKAITLVSRLETVNDIVLEIRIGPQTPGAPTPVMPFTFRLVEGKWVATQELGDSGFLPWFGKDTMAANLDFSPDPLFSGHSEPPVVGKSQKLFFQNQTRGASSATEFAW